MHYTTVKIQRPPRIYNQNSDYYIFSGSGKKKKFNKNNARKHMRTKKIKAVIDRTKARDIQQYVGSKVNSSYVNNRNLINQLQNQYQLNFAGAAAGLQREGDFKFNLLGKELENQKADVEKAKEIQNDNKSKIEVLKTEINNISKLGGDPTMMVNEISKLGDEIKDIQRQKKQNQTVSTMLLPGYQLGKIPSGQSGQSTKRKPELVSKTAASKQNLALFEDSTPSKNIRDDNAPREETKHEEPPSAINFLINTADDSMMGPELTKQFADIAKKEKEKKELDEKRIRAEMLLSNLKKQQLGYNDLKENGLKDLLKSLNAVNKANDKNYKSKTLTGTQVVLQGKIDDAMYALFRPTEDPYQKIGDIKPYVVENLATSGLIENILGREKKGSGDHSDIKKNPNGYKDDEGTTTSDLIMLMQPYRRLCNFLGVCCSDQVYDIMHSNNNIKEFSLIYNVLTTKDDPNENGHWIAIYCDGMSLEHYDPLEGTIMPSVMSQIEDFIEENYDHYLKLKLNKLKQESDTSAKCGELCCRFIICRGAFGIPFKTLTGWKPEYHKDDMIMQEFNEENLSKTKKKFDYI